MKEGTGPKKRLKQERGILCHLDSRARRITTQKASVSSRRIIVDTRGPIEARCYVRAYTRSAAGGFTKTRMRKASAAIRDLRELRGAFLEQIL